MYHFAVWNLRFAFEEERLPQKERNYHRAQDAAQWTIYSGNAIFHSLDVDMFTKQEFGNLSRGPLFQGKHGLSRERWDFWKMKFRALSETDIPEKVKASAIRAVEQMEDQEK